MRFTILSHAGLLVESDGVMLLIDPWIVGSCYWRSWWNYPKPTSIAGYASNIDYIYITHMHWDHFHGPSLRKLSGSAGVIIPRAHFPRMREDIEDFGFKAIVEIPHGKTVSLSPNLFVTSYQYGLSMDSALIISDGKVTLLNMNDCKISGAPLHQLLRRHTSVDFLFRSHSSASAYPHCVKAEDPAELRYRRNEDYLAEFVEMAKLVRPRFAIPFASNHCFLHRDTWSYNSTVVSPIDVQRYFEKYGPKDSRSIVMVPGDSWSNHEGFTLQDHDFFTNRDNYLAAYAEEVKAVLDAHYQREDSVRVPFAAFQRYFHDFILSLPRFGRIAFKPVVVFSLTNEPGRYWVIDFDRRSIYEARSLPSDYGFRIDVHSAVLKDCVEKRMFYTFTASKRLSVEVRKGKLKDFLIFFQLLDMYEYGYFPLRKMLTGRFLGTWFRRWREVAQYAKVVLAALLRRKGADPVLGFIPKVSSE